MKYLFIVLLVSNSLSAQLQTWQWVRAGGSSSDNASVQPAECKIAGCDALGNVYAVGAVNGPNMKLDTFSSAGAYSDNNVRISYLLFSYDCAGNMRWAKQIGDQEGNSNLFGVVTDPHGNTYFAGQFIYGFNGGLDKLFLGDSTIVPAAPIVTQPYVCLIKYDSLGKLVWFKNLQEDTAHAPHVGSFQTIPYGLRIGSSGNLWMGCNLDSNYAISSNLHTTLKGKYNVEVSPDSGIILGGYYTSNQEFGNSSDIDTYYDIDKDENYYETGTLLGDFGGGGDTLILANQTLAPNTSQTYVKPYIYSLDRYGNFRFIITNQSYCTNGYFRSCKYDYQSDRLVTCWGLNPGDIYQNDTFNFDPQNLAGFMVAQGLLTIDKNGNILWGKYRTKSNMHQGGNFLYAPLPFYSYHIENHGYFIYDNADTIFSKDSTSSASDYSTIISRVDKDGNMIATHTAHLGVVGSFLGDNGVKYGATDWRGNVYLGGTVTNFFATPSDSVVNTDHTSGNFFIAKLGTSDCSCPTPDVQFTQLIKGDTVYFFGSSMNHRDSIHWRLGDGTVSSSDTFSHLYAHDSTYAITAIAYSICGTDSITKQITVRNVGIATIEPNKTNLYPNPAKNEVNLEVSGPAKIGLVFANGASVWDGPIQVNQQGTYVFDMSRYSSALYYFIVEYTNGKVDVMQVVKE